MNKNIKLLFSLMIVLLGQQIAFAQNDYDVSLIPDSLKQNARAVVRVDNEELEITDEKQAKLNITYAITILNKNGNNDALLTVNYDKFLKVNNISGTVFGENGKKIKNIANSDIHDFSAISEFTTYEQSRIKAIDPEIRNYPFTVEYKYQIILKGTLQLPEWHPVNDYDVSIQNSEFKVIVPDNINIRYLEKNVPTPIQIDSDSKNTIYLWTAENIKPLKEEPFSGPLSAFTPTVRLGMNEFWIGGNYGDASTWNSFGKWIYSLNEGRNILPPETTEKLKSLVSTASSKADSVKILYNYMQNNTRYVSVQVGIGGWQAFEAETVDRLGYGDCKALSNYMQSILSSVGIKSYYTVVYAGAGEPNIDVNFPSNQFNHVIVCVPDKNDSIWLECTSQNIPCGYLGSFTDDRDVLVIKETGGELVHTPKYTKDDNKLITHGTVYLQADGSAQAAILRKHSGLFYDKTRSIVYSDDTDKKKQLYYTYNIPQFTIKSFQLDEQKSSSPYIIENSNLDLEKYGTKMGPNILLPVNLMNKIDAVPKKLKNRLSDVLIQRGYTKTDSIQYILPTGYKCSGLPENKTIDSEFGQLSTQYFINNDSLLYIRNFILNKGRYPKENYQQLIDFFEKAVKVDDQRVMLTPE